jgi:hypothetical protein
MCHTAAPFLPRVTGWYSKRTVCTACRTLCIELDNLAETLKTQPSFPYTMQMSRRTVFCGKEYMRVSSLVSIVAHRQCLCLASINLYWAAALYCPCCEHIRRFIFKPMSQLYSWLHAIHFRCCQVGVTSYWMRHPALRSWSPWKIVASHWQITNICWSTHIRLMVAVCLWLSLVTLVEPFQNTSLIPVRRDGRSVRV